VLVVDDFVPYADYLADVLRRNAHGPNSVLVAYEGTEAIRVADEFRPHALICDVHMPGMNGFELVETFAERFPNCGVVLITLDPTLLEWRYKDRVYKILQKVGAVEALREFLRTCEAGE